MDFNNYFHAFLESTVNLRPAKLDLLDERVGSIVAAFTADDDGGYLYKEHIPQGSWAHRTIIEPVDLNDEFDADFLMHLDWISEWEGSPKTYLQAVQGAFIRHGTYAKMLTRKNRCVRIQYAGSCHIDVVPAVTLPNGDMVIVNYQDDKFEDTNPTGFARWMLERDVMAGGHLRLAIRLLKWLRDYKNTFSCPSIILTVLLGERIGYDGAGKYPDLPTTLVSLLEDLDGWLTEHQKMPTIEDPSSPGTDFTHRWDEDQYHNFSRKIGDYATWAREAYDQQDIDPAAAVIAWQKLFGPEFASEPVEKAAALSNARALVAAESTRLQERAPAEEFIHELRRVEPRFNARIDATIVGTRSRNLRKAGAVRKNEELRFRVTTDAPEPYDVWWKVRNRGSEAARDLRGAIFRRGLEGRNQHREHTKYAGEHYVEAYVVKDDVVVASDHHRVRILP